MIYVCSLARLHETVRTTGARHVVSLLAHEDNLTRPATIAPENHLWLRLHDISAPQEGYVAPQIEHVKRLIAFVQRWPREQALVIHCYAGVSRSSAAAFAAVCALSPESDERGIAIALRRASPTATPNSRIVAIADQLLARRGRMVSAVEAIGIGIVAPEAAPFRLDLPAINAMSSMAAS
ncbi:MAG TPA: tyrosine protein phosphatase [Xanthobacteraceae bacterium]|jgi:predicted protein tyrosine phosphatase|nr:tyrosine protein phosphatase [Xanthobacteraceae bacterium]